MDLLTFLLQGAIIGLDDYFTNIKNTHKNPSLNTDYRYIVKLTEYYKHTHTLLFLVLIFSVYGRC